MTRLRIDIESDLKAVTGLGSTLHCACEAFGLPHELIYRIQTAVVEAATNSVRHAYELAPDKEVSLTMRLQNARVELEVIDNGKPMDPANADLLRNGSNVLDFDEADIAALPEGGLGLEIIHRCMDSVDYIRSEGMNCLRMTASPRVAQDSSE